MSNYTSRDEYYLLQAVELAKQFVGRTSPNPPVGAICIQTTEVNGALQEIVIGQGAHQGAGTPHAEVHCLSQWQEELSNATLYVTLEPCSTTGRTPPCCELILKRKPTRVVIGCLDPNPNHAGRAIPILESAGIEVVVADGLAADACRQLIAPFAKAITQGLPYVRLKLAMTLDGYLADGKHTSRWITGAEARLYVQHLRMQVDAVMVGAGTARIDHPSLQPHVENPTLKTRVIIDRTVPVAAADRDEQTLIATEDLNYDGENLSTPLRALCQRGINDILCEGGGQLAAALLDQGLVDELILIYAPKLLGDCHGVCGLPIAARRLPEAMQFEVVERQFFGSDTMIRLRPHKA